MGEKITNPVIRDLIKAAITDEEAREEIETKVRRLTDALKGVVSCLSEHLEQEAHEHELGVEALCPCSAGELKTAQDLLEELG